MFEYSSLTLDFWNDANMAQVCNQRGRKRCQLVEGREEGSGAPEMRQTFVIRELSIVRLERQIVTCNSCYLD